MINNTSIKEGNAMTRNTAFQVAPLFQCSLLLYFLLDMNNFAHYALHNIEHHSDALLIYLSKSKSMWEKVMWHRCYKLFNSTVTEELLMMHDPLLCLTCKQAHVLKVHGSCWIWMKRGGLQEFLHISSGFEFFFFFFEDFSSVAVGGY